MTNLFRSVFGPLRTLVKPKLTLRKTYCNRLLTFGTVTAIGCGVGYVALDLENPFKMLFETPSLLSIPEVYAKHVFEAESPLHHEWHEKKKLIDLAQQTIPAVVRIETKDGFGTGFFVGEGLILTNASLLGDSTNVTVTTDDQKSFKGVVQSSDKKRDLAVVRIRLGIRSVYKKYPILKLGDSDRVKNDESVMVFRCFTGMRAHAAFGEILGVNGPLLTFSAGFLCRRKSTGEKQEPSLLDVFRWACLKSEKQMPSLFICQKDSGAPLIDRNGEAVGVVTGVLTMNSIFRWKCYRCIPSNDAKNFLDEVKREELKQISSVQRIATDFRELVGNFIN